MITTHLFLDFSAPQIAAILVILLLIAWILSGFADYRAGADAAEICQAIEFGDRPSGHLPPGVRMGVTTLNFDDLIVLAQREGWIDAAKAGRFIERNRKRTNRYVRARIRYAVEDDSLTATLDSEMDVALSRSRYRTLRERARERRNAAAMRP